MIDYNEFWAHAHDWEQVLFMSFAPEFINSFIKYTNIEWLNKWKLYWQDHKENHGNGCSDIQLQEYLNTGQKKEIFISFIDDYIKWLEGFGDVISKDEVNKRINLGGMYYTQPCEMIYLVEFAEKVVAVVNGDESHPKVNKKSA